MRGENVMKGYYKNDEATADTFTDDGWLRTGDLGTIDKNNRIYIRGRSKTMMLGPSGQNIYPEGIEDKLNNLPFVMESIVIEKEGKLIALVYPDYDTVDNTGVYNKKAVLRIYTMIASYNLSEDKLKNILKEGVSSIQINTNRDRIKINYDEKAFKQLKSTLNTQYKILDKALDE